MADDTLLRERVQAMYAAGPGANNANLTLGILAVGVTWPYAQAEVLGAWALVLAASLWLRWQLVRWHARDAQAAHHTPLWAGRLTVAMALSGLTWGAGAAIFHLPESRLLMAFWAIMACGIAAGAVHAAAYHLPAQRAYLLPLLLPLALQHAWDAVPAGTARLAHGGIALGLLCYLGFCLGQGRRQAQLLHDALAMRHEKDHLLEALREQTALAEQARRHAEEAAQAKARFFAAASHDLRQPLQALGFLVAALREQPAAPAQQALLEQVGDGVDNLGNLFNGILGIARLDAGAEPGPMSTLPLEPLLRRITQQWAPAAHGRQLRLEFLPGRQEVFVRGNATALERMLGNLLSNAIRYTERGGVVVALRVAGRRVRIQVRDSGCGIAAQEHAQVFTEFYQSAGAAGGHDKGVGLGLATVQRLADAAGIGVSLRSCPGQGSTFTLHLDAVEAPSTMPTRPAMAATDRGDDVLQGAVAWVIDDVPEVRSGCVALLREWGMVVVARRTAQALDELEIQASAEPGVPGPQVIIVDQVREGQRALDLVARMRARWGAGLPALVISGTEDTLQRDSAAAQRIPWLRKPVKPPSLRATLQHLLAQDRHTGPTPGRRTDHRKEDRTED